MTKTRPTKEAKEWYSRVASLGCICCGKPTQIHHNTRHRGKGQKSHWRLVLPLCHTHHTTGGHGNAIHAGTETWEAIFGTQEELLERVYIMLEVDFNLAKKHFIYVQ
jgi:hypothetical protein